jgi:hypothetical protein
VCVAASVSNLPHILHVTLLNSQKKMKERKQKNREKETIVSMMISSGPISI